MRSIPGSLPPIGRSLSSQRRAGAASAYLHLGVLGPRRLAFGQ